MFKKIIALTVVALFALTATALAELSAVGPVNPQNGFPVWYQDSNGTAVELGLDPALNLFDPPIPGNNFSEQIGFGAEGFYWIAETALDFPGGSIFYRANLEYAWVNELPADGDQFVFTRLRFRIDAPVAGEYTVTHPYGVDTFVADAPGVRAINVTIDVGGATPDFTTALTGRVGPFLTMVDPAPPAGFLGNGAVVAGTVTGSPFGNNFLRIQGPGGIDASTDQFTVSAKIFTGQVNTPLTVDRATYTRDVHDSVNVIANSTPNATVSIEGLTTFPATMSGDGTGKFYRHVHDAGPLPPTITVRADDNPLDPIIQPTGVIKNLVDHVTVTRAEYDTNAKTLAIDAVSGDQVNLPVLTAVGFGELVNGTLTVSGVIVPSNSVTVTSSSGGSDTRTVNIVEIAPPVANAAPAAANDTVIASSNIAVSINVVANDTDIDGTIDPASVVIVSSPLNGTVVSNLDGTVTYTSLTGFVGSDTFTYTVNDDLGQTSNIATVTVNVASAPVANASPVAVNDTLTTNLNTAGTVNVIANDTDADGTINAASVVIVTSPVNGIAVSNGDGTVTYTPNTGFSGADSFTYTVRDNLLALSNTATVNITVLAVPPEIINVTTSLFRIIGARWIVSGTDTVSGAVLTLSIEGGATLGTATVSTLGVWSFIARNSTIIPVAGDTLRIDSSNGTTLRNVPLTIRN